MASGYYVVTIIHGKCTGILASIGSCSAFRCLREYRADAAAHSSPAVGMVGGLTTLTSWNKGLASGFCPVELTASGHQRQLKEGFFCLVQLAFRL